MCLAVPLEVVAIKENLATVSFGNTTREVYLDLVDTVSVGDFILVHAGFAIEKLDKEEAAKTLALFEEIMSIARSPIEIASEGLTLSLASTKNIGSGCGLRWWTS